MFELNTQTVTFAQVNAYGDYGAWNVIRIDRLLAIIGLVNSISDGRRKIKEGAVRIDGTRCYERVFVTDSTKDDTLNIRVGRQHLLVLLK